MRGASPLVPLVAVLACVAGDVGGQAVGSVITRRHHEDPGALKCWSIVPRGA